MSFFIRHVLSPRTGRGEHCSAQFSPGPDGNRGVGLGDSGGP